MTLEIKIFLPDNKSQSGLSIPTTYTVDLRRKFWDDVRCAVALYAQLMKRETTSETCKVYSKEGNVKNTGANQVWAFNSLQHGILYTGRHYLPPHQKQRNGIFV